MSPVDRATLDMAMRHTTSHLTPAQLRGMVEAGSPLYDSIPFFTRMGMGFARDQIADALASLTALQCLPAIQRVRPDLAPILATAEGQQWLTRQLADLRGRVADRSGAA